MPSSVSDRIQKLIELSREAELDRDRELGKLFKLLALEPEVSVLNDFEQVLASKASRSLIDPFHPYDSLEGNIELGKAPGFRFGITDEILRQNMLVVGQSGAGKTNLFYNLALQLSEEVPFWIFDFKQDFRHLLNYDGEIVVIPTEQLKFNPLRPPKGVSPLRWIQIFADVFGDSQALLSGSKNFLVTHIHQLFKLYDVFSSEENEERAFPSMHELAELMHYKSFPLQTKEARYLETTMNRIQAAVLTIGGIFDCSRGYPLPELLNRNVVFELEGISSDFQNFIVEVLLAWVYHYRMAQGSRGKLRHAIFFDEAKRIFDKSKEKRYAQGVPLIDLITARTREFGEALIVGDQEASKLTDSIKANTYTKIMLSSGSGKDIDEMSEAMGLTQRQKELSFELRSGEGIVKVSGNDPFPVKFPLVPLQKDVSYSQVLKSSEEKLSKYESSVKEREKPDKYQEFIEKISTGKMKKKFSTFQNGELDQDRMSFLTHVAEKPFLFHGDRYDSLGLSGSKGNRIKKDLVREGYLEEEEINTGKRGANPKIVGLTEKGKRVLKDKEIEVEERGKGGLEHRFWQHMIAQHFENQGFKAHIEYELEGKGIDVYAENKKKIGIEVAMSPKGEVDNLEKDLELDLDKLIVASKNERIMSEIGVQARGYFGKEKIAGIEFKVAADFLR